MAGADDIASPWDLLTRGRSPLHPRFRRLSSAADPPPGLPYGFTLGPALAPGNDWSVFAEEANARGLVEASHKVLICYEPATPEDAKDFAASLDAQIFAGRIALRLYGPAARRAAMRETIAVELDARRLSSARTHAAVIAAAADTVIFLTGACVLDPYALERICRMTRISRLIVVPLAEKSATPDRAVGVPATVAEWPASAPYRAVRGLNLAVPGTLAAQLGGFARGFEQPHLVGMEYAYRCYRGGAYFAPVFVPKLSGGDGEHAPVSDRRRFISLVPEPQDNGAYAMPRVSLLLSAKAGTERLSATIADLIATGVRDFEICVWGASKSLRLKDRLKWHFNRLAHVRAIHTASLDEAIAATRAEYVGLLDGGAQIQPVALDQCIARLDGNPELAAVRLGRGRSEETESQGARARSGSDALMMSPGTGHFVLFRRSAWERSRASSPRHDEPADLLLELASTGSVGRTRSSRFKRSDKRAMATPHQIAERIRRELERRRLTPFWTSVPQPPPENSLWLRRTGDSRLVIFWPDYSRGNAYQRLLYGAGPHDDEYVSGDIDLAIRAALSLGGGRITFHMHWSNPLFQDGEDEATVRADAEVFLERVAQFKGLGGTIVWTLHNTVTHNGQYRALEISFSKTLVALADRVHLHSIRSLPEVEVHFPIPREKLRVARHGNYLRVYADYLPRAAARRALGLDETDDVLLFAGRLRPYKGLSELVAVFRRLLPDNPRLKLVLAGLSIAGEGTGLLDGLSTVERDRVLLVERFLGEDEMQLFFRAADVGVFPYDEVLTSGSILLALSFGLPVVAPRFGMISEAVEADGGAIAGKLYERDDPSGLEMALRQMLAAKRADGLEALRTAARSAAERNTWQPFSATVLD